MKEATKLLLTCIVFTTLVGFIAYQHGRLDGYLEGNTDALIYANRIECAFTAVQSIAAYLNGAATTTVMDTKHI